MFEVLNFCCFQGKFQEAGKLYKKTGNDEKVWYMYGCAIKLSLAKRLGLQTG